VELAQNISNFTVDMYNLVFTYVIVFNQLTCFMV
jgi:hypothetical protein